MREKDKDRFYSPLCSTEAFDVNYNRRWFARWPAEEKIQHLQKELRAAWELIIHPMPEKAQRILHSYWDCSAGDRSCWKDETAVRIVILARELPNSPGRADCPLCGFGGHSPDPSEQGLKIPAELEMHLTGKGGVPECGVFKAAFNLALDYWDSQFGERDDAEDRARQARIVKRLDMEAHCRTDKRDSPGLIDWTGRFAVADTCDAEEMVWAEERLQSLEFSDTRDADEMMWAEERLQTLGFKIVMNGSMKEYVEETSEHAIWADPRCKRRISFKAYKKVMRPDGKETILRKRGWFDLPDDCIRTIEDKYRARRDLALMIRRI